ELSVDEWPRQACGSVYMGEAGVDRHARGLSARGRRHIAGRDALAGGTQGGECQPARKVSSGPHQNTIAAGGRREKRRPRRRGVSIPLTLTPTHFPGSDWPNTVLLLAALEARPCNFAGFCLFSF